MNSTLTNNFTQGLGRLILAMADDERHSYKVQFNCHIVSCIFAVNDHDDQNHTCRVIADLGPGEDGQQQHNHSYVTSIANSVYLYIYPLFIIMGILGNSLSCLIMLMNVRRAGGNPASLYLTLLAFVDCLFLVGSALPDWISQIHPQFDLRLLSDAACRLVYWFGHLTTHLSTGLVVGVTVERFIAVQYPLIAHKINTITRTRFALVLLMIFYLIIDSPVLILVKHINESVHSVRSCLNDTLVNYERQDTIRCDLTTKRYRKTWVYVDFAVYTLIPFLIIVTLNSLIIRRLIDAQRFRQHMFRFHNYASSSRYDSSESKSRRYSDGHQAMELIEKASRPCHRFQTLPETKPLAMMLRPQFNHQEDRRVCYSIKQQSSISTEMSSLSFEMKTRWQHHYESASIRHRKSLNTSRANNTRLTILLLFVSCSFLALTLPTVVLNLIISNQAKTLPSILSHNHLDSISTGTSQPETTLYYTVTRLLMIMNHSINFILYLLLGKRFRRDLKQLFINYWRQLYRQKRRRWRRRRQSSKQIREN